MNDGELTGIDGSGLRSINRNDRKLASDSVAGACARLSHNWTIMNPLTSAWLDASGLTEMLAGLPPRRWLVTGAAGFIGSHLAEALLHLGQDVRGLDNFSTGYPRNIEVVSRTIGGGTGTYEFIEGDIRDFGTCTEICRDIDIVLHQAALGSVPRSIVDPLTTNAVNINGFLNMLQAAREANVARFVYAASSSTYGDEPTLPKREDRIGRPLSPYAVTKLVNEMYADVFARSYGFRATGLRYFNVFGPRQDPNGAYAAVIPRWIKTMIDQEPITINGDGRTSRDFCYVANAVQANLKAALAEEDLQGTVYNVAVSDRTTLLELFAGIRDQLEHRQIHYRQAPIHVDERAGDIRHSQADISKAAAFGYRPTHRVAQGLDETVGWYLTPDP